MLQKIIDFFYRPADEIILQDGEPYLYRWYVVKNRKCNIYIHRFVKSDEDRALHDHPWPSLGMILWGKYKEHMPKNQYEWVTKGNREEVTKTRWMFQPVYRDANSIHRVELFADENSHYPFASDPSKWQSLKPVWTLFMTGPWRREWGFWCPKGFVHWKRFTSEDGLSIGQGCGDDKN